MQFHTPLLLSSNQSGIMEKLKEAVLRLANSDPNRPLSPSQIALLEQRLLLAFPVLHNPTHPTYAAMIQSAIKELNEEDGSNEESISEYIKANYEGLPWAHDMYLSHHLSKLCKNGEILFASTSKCYTTPARAVLQGRNFREKMPEGRLRRKTKEWVMDQNEEGNSGGENGVEASGNLIGFHEEDIMVFGRSKVKRRRSLVFEDDDEVGEQNTISSSKNLVGERQDDEGLTLEDGDVFIEECPHIPRVGDDHDHPSNVGELQEKCKGEKELALKESELMIVPYVGNNKPILAVNSGINSISEIIHPMTVCALAELPKQEQQVCKYSLKKSLKERQEKKNVSSESMPKRSKAHQEKKKVSMESMPSFPALTVGDRNLLEHDQLHELLPRRGLESKESGMESETGPPWLMSMLKGQYFTSCSVHQDSPRSEKNMFCLDCMGDPFCSNCLSFHDKDHHVLQIRRSSYHNAVRVDDIQKHLDISHIQPYIINSAKIVFLNARPRPKFAKCISNPCEICHYSLIDSSRFCSLGCKLHATLMESSKFGLVVDQSQQACSLEVGFIEQLERNEYFDLPNPSSPKELMSAEDEENLPLQMVLEKCGKRKKYAVQKPVAEAPLGIEASSISGSKSQADLSNSENSERMMPIVVPNLTSTKSKERQHCQLDLEGPSEPARNLIVEETASIIDEVKSHEWESDEGILNCDPGPPGFVVTGLVASHSLQREQESHQNQAVAESPISEPSLQNPKHQRINQEIQSCQNDFRLQKQLQASKEDSVPSMNEHLQLQERLSKHVKKKDGRGRPRKEKGAIKQVKKGGRGRPRKQMEATNQEAAVGLSNLHPPQQEELSEPATDLHLKNPRSQKQIETTKEDEPASLNLCLQPREGSSEFVFSQNSLQQITLLKEDGRGRQIEGTMDYAEASPNLHLPLQEGSHKLLNSQQQYKLLKKNGRGRPRKQPGSSIKKEIEGPKKKGRGRPRKQIEVAKEDAVAFTHLDVQQQPGSFQPETHQLSPLQVRKGKQDGRGRPRKQKEGTENNTTTSKILHFGGQESQSEPAFFQNSQQQNKKVKKDGRGRPRKQTVVNKEDLAAPLNLIHKLEKETSNLEKESKADDFPDTELEKFESEVQNPNLSNETEPLRSITASVPLDDGSLAQEKEYKQHDVSVSEPEKSQSEAHGTPETGLAVPTLDDDKRDNQLAQQQEQHCLEHKVQQGPVEGQVRPFKEKSPKVTATQVPLSSKDQLRSRINRQSQDST